ncbi:hypothetical protein C7S15_7813 [Burkholderia cepacia]|nr:hypothetical protein [Burkholderia cepacia]
MSRLAAHLSGICRTIRGGVVRVNPDATPTEASCHRAPPVCAADTAIRGVGVSCGTAISRVPPRPPKAGVVVPR